MLTAASEFWRGVRVWAGLILAFGGRLGPLGLQGFRTFYGPKANGLETYGFKSAHHGIRLRVNEPRSPGKQ